jgi:hypothetical protein
MVIWNQEMPFGIVNHDIKGTPRIFFQKCCARLNVAALIQTQAKA